MADAYDVGVLVVHGIGTQSKGSTLRDWVDSVVRYLAALKPPTPGDSGRDGVAMLSPPEENFVGLRTPRLGYGDQQEWLVTEAWWAECFDPPTRGEVTRWLLDIGPWFAYFFAARLWRRHRVHVVDVGIGLWVALPVAIRAYGIASEWNDQLLVLAALGVVAMLLRGWMRRHQVGKAAPAIVAATVLIVLPAAALITLAMIVLWIVGLIPGKPGAKVRAFQLALTRSIGDAYVLIASPRRERLMFDAITEALKKLLSHLPSPTTPLVIAAHSQGAALSFRLFDRDQNFRSLLAGRDLTLVTHGSAILPIHVLERRRLQPGGSWRRLQSLAGFIGLVLLVATFGRLVGDTLTFSVRIVALVGAGLATVAFVLAQGDVRSSECPPTPPASSAEDGLRKLGPVTRVGPGPLVHDAPEHPRYETHGALVAQTALAFAGVYAAKEAAGGTTAVDHVCPTLPVPSGSKLRWVDIYATWDPVPNGPLDLNRGSYDANKPFGALLPPIPPFFEDSHFIPCRAANDFQPWRDHTIYKSNFEDVVSRWVLEVAYRGGLKSPAGVDRPPPAKPDLPANAEPWDDSTRPRDYKRARGSLLLCLQGALVLVALASGIRRSASLDDLGRAAIRFTPARNVLAPAVDVIPEKLREVALGANHDPTRIQGVLIAIALAGVLLLFGTGTSALFATRASKRYLAGRRTRRTLAMAVTSAAFLVSALACVYVAWADDVEGDARIVTISVRHLPGLAQYRPDVAVTFQPVGFGEDAALVRKVHRNSAKAYLDPDLSYVASAEAVGGDKCEVKLTQNKAVVRCARAGTPIPRADR